MLFGYRALAAVYNSRLTLRNKQSAALLGQVQAAQRKIRHWGPPVPSPSSSESVGCFSALPNTSFFHLFQLKG